MYRLCDVCSVEVPYPSGVRNARYKRARSWQQHINGRGHQEASQARVEAIKKHQEEAIKKHYAEARQLLLLVYIKHRAQAFGSVDACRERCPVLSAKRAMCELQVALENNLSILENLTSEGGTDEDLTAVVFERRDLKKRFQKHQLGAEKKYWSVLLVNRLGCDMVDTILSFLWP